MSITFVQRETVSEILNKTSEVSLFWEPLNNENLDVSIDKRLITVHAVYTNDGPIYHSSILMFIDKGVFSVHFWIVYSRC